MIALQTYLRDGDAFIAVDQFEGDIRDPMHIEGAIELTVNGVVLMDRSLYDDVDQLWSYLAQATLDCADRGSGSTLFPDTPIRVSLERVKGDQIEIEIDWPRPEGRRARASSAEFVRAVYDHGKAFFDRMTSLAPQNRPAYQDSLSRLARATSLLDR